MKAALELAALELAAVTDWTVRTYNVLMKKGVRTLLDLIEIDMDTDTVQRGSGDGILKITPRFYWKELPEDVSDFSFGEGEYREIEAAQKIARRKLYAAIDSETVIVDMGE